MSSSVIPENFKTTIIDFANDLTITFPEYCGLWKKWTKPETSDAEFEELFGYCLTVYPERFFDLLYQNNELFDPKSEINTRFLPYVDFKILFNCEGVTENTQKSIWKYLQLVMFTLVGSIKDKSDFGDSANLFEGIDESELHEKMKDTFQGVSDFFNKMNFETKENGDNSAEETDKSNSEDTGDEIPEFTFDKTTGMPNMENLHEHLKGLFDGKIGRLAKNIAEEISSEFNNILGGDDDSPQTTKDVFQKLMKNPKQMMDLVKKIGDKIKKKMDDGEISKDEIMREAGDLLKKMKEMGGEGADMQEMFKNFAKNMGMNIPKGAKIDTNALNRMSKQEAMRERIRTKVNAKKQEPQNYVLEQNGPNTNMVFRMPGEGEQERSAAPPALTDEELIAVFGENGPSTGAPKSGGGKKKKNKGKK
jgi:hypothetical protein